MTPEGKVKDKVKKVLKEFNAYYVMPMGTGFGNAGVPDFVACHHGVFIGIECKAGSNWNLTSLQRSNLEQILRCGGRSLVINETNVDELRAILEIL